MTAIAVDEEKRNEEGEEIDEKIAGRSDEKGDPIDSHRKTADPLCGRERSRTHPLTN